MSVSARLVFVALAVGFALPAVGCGDTAADNNKPNPALGEPSKDGPPSRSVPGVANPGKK